jgi:hypothetical protein
MMAPLKKARAALAPPESSPAARQAQVVLDVEVADGCMHLVLANCGDAVATDVSVKFSRKLRGLGGTVVISELPLFKQMGVLRPGRELRVLWDAAPSIVRGKEAAPFSATVSWTEPGSASRARNSATYRHDPSIYRVWPECVPSKA